MVSRVSSLNSVWSQEELRAKKYRVLSGRGLPSSSGKVCHHSRPYLVASLCSFDAVNSCFVDDLRPPGLWKTVSLTCSCSERSLSAVLKPRTCFSFGKSRNTSTWCSSCWFRYEYRKLPVLPAPLFYRGSFVVSHSRVRSWLVWTHTTSLYEKIVLSGRNSFVLYWNTRWQTNKRIK